MQRTKVKIKLDKGAKIPYKKHSTDACYDIVATSMKDYGDGRIEYGLGIHMTPKDFSVIDIKPRSSVHKTGLILSNCIAVGDEDYTGEYKAVFYNVIPSLPNYEVGDRILQMQISPRVDIEFIEVDELGETERGDGGFGSTGLK